MARAVDFPTASQNFYALHNAEMDKKAAVARTYHQITTGKKSSVGANVTIRENYINNTEIETEVYDPHHCRTLFVRFPYRIKDKLEVKLLYPGIEAVRFKPRIKRYCFVI
jgi:hypothetical protein